MKWANKKSPEAATYRTRNIKTFYLLLLYHILIKNGGFMNQVKKVFERLKDIDEEILNLNKELKKSEHLFYKENDPLVKKELELNIDNINLKIKQLQSEDEHLEWLLNSISKGGIMI